MDRNASDKNLPMSLMAGGPSSQNQSDKLKAQGVRRPSGARLCAKCGKPLSGQFVRALDATYHLECFTCHVLLPVYDNDEDSVLNY